MMKIILPLVRDSDNTSRPGEATISGDDETIHLSIKGSFFDDRVLTFRTEDFVRVLKAFKK